MLYWQIAMGDRQAPLESVGVVAIREVTDPIRDHIAGALTPIAQDGDLTIVFVVESDRSLSVRLRGEAFMVNQARDILGKEQKIGPLLT